MAKIQLPSIKKAVKIVKQKNDATNIAHNMLNGDTEALARTMTNGLPKATHKQSIQAVMKAIAVEADPTVPKKVKKATALAATMIVENSNSMDLADQMDETIGQQARELMQNLQNQQ